MKYRIKYTNGRHCKIIEDRNDLIKELKISKDSVSDVRKIFKNGISDSVFETYKRYLER